MSKKKSNPKKLQNKPTQTIVNSTPELAEISIKNISCSSRVSFKQGEAYYTFEYKEEIRAELDYNIKKLEEFITANNVPNDDTQDYQVHAWW